MVALLPLRKNGGRPPLSPSVGANKEPFDGAVNIYGAYISPGFRVTGGPTGAMDIMLQSLGRRYLRDQHQENGLQCTRREAKLFSQSITAMISGLLKRPRFRNGAPLERA